MVRGVLLALLLAGTDAAQASAEKVDIARWAAALPHHFVVKGFKSEPTWEEAIEIRRTDNRFIVTGGAPAWAEQLTESVTVGEGGQLQANPCPQSTCPLKAVPAGFLATAALASAEVQGRLRGMFSVIPYGERSVVCVPAETLGVKNPILDPCFDRETGAVLAQRHRASGRFEGASLDPSSVRTDGEEPNISRR